MKKSIHIYLTSFEPFRARTENQSQVVALELSKRLKDPLSYQIPNPHNLTVELSSDVLPVRFGVAADLAIKRFDSFEMRPDLVLSLGEGGVGAINVEKVAFNQDGTSFDEDGQIGSCGEPLVEGGEDVLSLRLPFELWRSGLSESNRKFLKSTETIGQFVCNNTAYLMANALPQSVPYGFIHIPMIWNGTGLTPKKAADLLATAILSVEDYFPIESDAVNRP